ncbi:hypothetical protein EYF80_005212 [Liparis tanakae]|uniref:Uncharacterized protein n=1 Tax=Liparis tanakae TaxID=230148 RepID=A0A4Z2J4W1_9TELE|nr:hypothetical protein EYF80_005212 [Liparis tanakae]
MRALVLLQLQLKQPATTHLGFSTMALLWDVCLPARPPCTMLLVGFMKGFNARGHFYFFNWEIH